jgi:hypothetical protein
MKTTTATVIEYKSLITSGSVTKQPSVNEPFTNLKHESLESSDDTELELEGIMFEELAYGLPSDIPMCDF